jgi:hypothetical protein|eukprot:COSAG01_NODE_960_length_12416_cov_3.072501_11_plen_34_part_00
MFITLMLHLRVLQILNTYDESLHVRHIWRPQGL